MSPNVKFWLRKRKGKLRKCVSKDIFGFLSYIRGEKINLLFPIRAECFHQENNSILCELILLGYSDGPAATVMEKLLALKAETVFYYEFHCKISLSSH